MTEPRDLSAVSLGDMIARIREMSKRDSAPLSIRPTEVLAAPIRAQATVDPILVGYRYRVTLTGDAGRKEITLSASSEDAAAREGLRLYVEEAEARTHGRSRPPDPA